MEKTIRFLGGDEESNNLGFEELENYTKETHAILSSSATLCGLDMTQGQKFELVDSNVVTCPDCIELMNCAKKYKVGKKR